jgi:hypothetical protein
MEKAKKVMAGASAFIHLAAAFVKANSKEAKTLDYIGQVIDAFVSGSPIPLPPAGVPTVKG